MIGYSQHHERIESI